MDKINWKLIVLAVIVGIVALLVLRLFINSAGATAPEPYATICHHNPSQNVTLEFANEQSYEGHLSTPHSDTVFDTEGACEEEPTDYCDTLEGVQAEDTDCPVEEETCPPGTHEVKNEAWEYEEEYELVCIPDEVIDYCETLEGVQKEDEDCPREEPTPTPVDEGGGTPATFAGSSTNAPTCPDSDPTQQVANFHIVRDGQDAIAKWVPEGDYKVAIYYGLNGQGQQHSVVTENDGHEVINLFSNADYTFWAQYLKGCAAGPMSGSVIDSFGKYLCRQGVVDLCRPI